MEHAERFEKLEKDATRHRQEIQDLQNKVAQLEASLHRLEASIRKVGGH